MKLLIKIARFISWVGHPLFTSAAVVVFIAFSTLPLATALLCSGGLVLGVIIPINLWTYRSVKQGRFTDFDISVQKQRGPWYIKLLVLFTTATLVLYIAMPNSDFVTGCFLCCLLLLTCYAVNPRVKVSLHTCLSLYFAACLFITFPLYGWLYLTFTLLISFSRLVLKRHTIKEVAGGFLIGMLYGGVLMMML